MLLADLSNLLLDRPMFTFDDSIDILGYAIYLKPQNHSRATIDGDLANQPATAEALTKFLESLLNRAPIQICHEDYLDHHEM